MFLNHRSHLLNTAFSCGETTFLEYVNKFLLESIDRGMHKGDPVCSR